jgi:hypothetical protein
VNLSCFLRRIVDLCLRYAEQGDKPGGVAIARPGESLGFPISHDKAKRGV